MNTIRSIPTFAFALFAAAAVPHVALADSSTAIPSSSATQARLGIAVSQLPEMLASHLPEVFDKGRGVLVSDVVENSAADQAGIKQYDVLVRYDDQDLYSTEQLVKRVRNDKPGTEVEIQFVRAGKLQTVKVKLGEEPVQEKIYDDWPGFNSRFNVPWSPLRPEFWTEAQDALSEGTEWTEFEALSVSKGADGQYTVRIEYTDRDGKSIGREFKGTRQEIRDAINVDNELPESRKNQLMRTLDDRGRMPAAEFRFPMPKWNNWQRELFNWPNVDF